MKTLQRLRRVFRPPLLKRISFIILNYVKNHRLGKSLHQFSDSHRPTGPVPRSFEHGVAVMIPCFNHGAYLESAIASIANQTYHPLQLVLVDDCSTDDSYAIMRRFMHQLSDKVTVLALKTPRNSGQAYAVNMGISATDASVIMMLDADDYLMHDAVEIGLDLLHRHQEVYLLGASSVVFQGNGSPSTNAPLTIKEIAPDYLNAPVTRYEPSDILRVKKPNDINMTHSGMIFFRSAWQVVGGYYQERHRRTVIFTDRDFQLRVGSLLSIGVCETVPFAYYREGSSVQFGGSGDSAALWSPQSLLSSRHEN